MAAPYDAIRRTEVDMTVARGPSPTGWQSASSGPLSLEIRESIARAASCDLPVHLEGETGSGKTYLARLIHCSSPRAAQPFITVSCATLPPSLIEAELFGNERGAYTDAREQRAGFIEQANGGTLFLDEIAELGLSQQSKLLTVFDDAWVRRIGGTRQIPVNVRFISATNEDLAELIRQRLFRQDLYYRCRVLTIRMPPLRERRREIPAITRFLLDQIAPPSTADHPRDRRITLAPDAMRQLCAFDWPGNIRELKAVLELAALKATGPMIELDHLDLGSAAVRRSPSSDTPESVGGNGTGRRVRYHAPADPTLERETIVAALRTAEGNRTQAAKALGMSRSVLWERLRYFTIDTSEWLESASPATPGRSALNAFRGSLTSEHRSDSVRTLRKVE